MRAWLEDSIPQEFVDGINNSKDLYTSEKEVENVTAIYGEFVSKRKIEFETLLKIEEKTEK
jgi:hypothetical protein